MGVVFGRVMSDIGDAYVITVEHAGRSVSAVIGCRQVEEWLANMWNRTEVTSTMAPLVLTGTQRVVLHALVREVMEVPA